MHRVARIKEYTVGMMNKKAVLGIGLAVLIIGSLVIWQTAEAPTDGEAGRVMSVEQYVSDNISELSPVDAILGGTFYVTEIEAEGGKGVVSYEDGHIALTADFIYTVDEERGGILISSFIVRD